MNSMATPIAIPQEGTIYAKLLRLMNLKSYAKLCSLYEMLEPREHQVLKFSYPEIYQMLNEIYVCEKMATATLTNNT